MTTTVRIEKADSTNYEILITTMDGATKASSALLLNPAQQVELMMWKRRFLVITKTNNGEAEPTPMGLYNKYAILNSDGSVPAIDSDYFVLKLNASDPVHANAAQVAFEVYQRLVADKSPELSRDMYNHLRQYRPEPAPNLDLKLCNTTDARVWAKEFCHLNPALDEGTMIGWFANAIETGRSAGVNATRSELHHADCPNCSHPYTVETEHQFPCKECGATLPNP